MEPSRLGAVARADNLMQLSTKVCKILSTLIADSSTAKTVGKNIKHKIRTLQELSKTFRNILKSCEQLVRPDTELHKIWGGIEVSLDDCTEILNEWATFVRKQLVSDKNRILLNNALQLKVREKQSAFANFENKIDCYLRILQVYLYCLQISINIYGGDTLLEKLNRLEALITNNRSLLTKIPETQDQLAGTNPSNFDEFDQDDSTISLSFDVNGTNIQSTWNECIGTAALILTTWRRCSSDSLGHSLGHESTRTLTNRDREEEFQDFTHQEVIKELLGRLEKRVQQDISSSCLRLEKRVQQDISSSCLRRAEANQLEIIRLSKELEEYYNVPSIDYTDMKVLLAKIYLHQCEFDKAAAMENIAFQGQTTRSSVSDVPRSEGQRQLFSHPRAKHYLFLSLIYYERYFHEHHHRHLESAERYAKRAFICSRESSSVYWKTSETFIEIVYLLVKIYETMGKFDHVDTYKSLYLKNSDTRSTSKATLPAISRASTINIPSSISDPESSSNKRSNSLPINLLASAVTNQNFIIDKILLPGADPEEKFGSNKTLILESVDRGLDQTVRELHYRGANINPGLLHAVCTGNTQMVELLLRLGADIETKDDNELTPLLIAAKGNSPSVLRTLLSEKIELQAKSSSGWTALHYIVNTSNIEMLRTLLEIAIPQPSEQAPGLDINSVCKDGKSALHYAAERGNCGFARILIQYGANVELEDLAWPPRTCLYLAVDKGRLDFVKMLVEEYKVFVRHELLPPTLHSINDYLTNKETPVAYVKARRRSLGWRIFSTLGLA